MRTQKKIAALLLLLPAFWACIQEVTIELEDSGPDFVLSCILDASRDTIVASLTQTKGISSEEAFPIVTNAGISLFENGQYIGDFMYTSSGRYILNYKPVPATNYRIQAETQTLTLWAETRVPGAVEASFKKQTSGPSGYAITFKDEPNEANFYWLTATGFPYHPDTIDNKQQKVIAGIIFSSFEYADNFNRIASEAGMYEFEYDYYIRVPDIQLPNEPISVIFLPMVGTSPELFLLSTDTHLDKYMKSSLLTYQMERDAEEMPVIYSPQPVYSNIHGGTGIFGSFYSVSENFPENEY